MTERERSLIVVMTPLPGLVQRAPGFPHRFLATPPVGLDRRLPSTPSPRMTGAQSGFLSYGALLSAFSPETPAVRSTLRKVLSARFSCLASSTLVGEVLVLGASAATAAVLSLALRQLSLAPFSGSARRRSSLGPSAPSSAPACPPLPSTCTRALSVGQVTQRRPGRGHFPPLSGVPGAHPRRTAASPALVPRQKVGVSRLSRRAASSAAFFWWCFL